MSVVNSVKVIALIGSTFFLSSSVNAIPCFKPTASVKVETGETEYCECKASLPGGGTDSITSFSEVRCRDFLSNTRHRYARCTYNKKLSTEEEACALALEKAEDYVRVLLPCEGYCTPSGASDEKECKVKNPSRPVIVVEEGKVVKLDNDEITCEAIAKGDCECPTT